MQNPLVDGRPVRYYLLESVRNPELWLKQNSNVPNAQKRYEARVALKAQLCHHSVRFADNYQYIFVAVSADGSLEILDGEIINDTRLALDDGILNVDLQKERVIFEERVGDLEVRLWQSTESGWMRARRPNQKKIRVDPNDPIEVFKRQVELRRVEQERLLEDIRARKASLAVAQS